MRVQNKRKAPPTKTYKTDAKRQKTSSVGFYNAGQLPSKYPSGEMKYFDCELQNSAIPATTTTWVATTMQDPATTNNLGDPAIATPLCLFAPKVSASLNGRIGRKVTMLKCKLHGLITCAPQAAQNTADSPTLVRMMLVMDMQTNAAQMTGAQLMNDSTSGAPVTFSSFQNVNNFGRFKVLKEKLFNFSNFNMTGSPTAGDVIQDGVVRHVKMSYRFMNPVEVNFNATNGGTVADIINNSLHIVAACNNTALAPQLSYYTRVCYKE